VRAGEYGDGVIAPLWTPAPERAAASQMERFRSRIATRHGADVDDTVALHRWSVEHPGEFWQEVWDDSGIVGDPGATAYRPGEMRTARFFPQASFNLAENLLAERDGAAEEAIVAISEGMPRRAMTWTELRADVAAVAAFLLDNGVGPGDRVAAWMPNVPETVVAMLAASSIGAVFTSTSSDFGVGGVVDRFGQTEPVVLLAADGYRYGDKEFDCMERLAEIVAALPSVRRVLLVCLLNERRDATSVPLVVHWHDVVHEYDGPASAFTRTGGDHPAYVLYSSGTTGKPKCIVHRGLGVLLMHLKEQRLHCDIRPGDRVMYFTTAGWMMWNWLVSALACGATIVLYDGNPAHPRPERLFDIAEQEKLTLLGVSAKYLDMVNKAGAHPVDTHHLEELRTICSTGSPLSADGFRFVYEAVAADVHLASISGGTDLCGCFVLGDPTRPVFPGELQGPGMGMAVEVFGADGTPLAAGTGELVCTVPFPSVPLGFWGDDDGSRFAAAYFERFPGVWAHGDFASWTEQGGMVIHGRSDATLNASGVRIGTAEIYNEVDRMVEVAESVVVGQEHDGDTRIVLFVRMAAGHSLTPELAGEIRRRLRTNASPRHVPAVVLEVADIPRTRSNKLSELAVADVVNGREVRNTESLANPESLADFAHRPELA
jgi:acetoacetyl-CoA synthetase